MSSGPVLLFEIYVEDDRYAVPTLRLLVADDHLSAHELAAKVLHESAHHTAVEVRVGDRRVAALRACASRASRRPRSYAARGMRG